MKWLPVFVLLFWVTACRHSPQTVTAFNAPPAWARDAIWYQVFVERFYNGDTTNDPTAASIEIPPIGVKAPQGWHITPWQQDWYRRDDYASDSSQSFNAALQYRRYGGDLQGLLLKLDYLKELGINALYLNPVNHAPSLHKYDASYYHHVDAHFGPDPEGDKKLMARENPADPKTWKWTAADRLFLKVVEEAHRRGIRVILDVSWNHTGTLFWAWQDILKNGSTSPYRDWYAIQQFDDLSTPENELKYSGWLNIPSLPEIRKVNITTARKIGHPYQGDINEGAKHHFFEVTRRWLAPDGDTSRGIDGFRLDVADHVGMVFWRSWRKVVRQTKADAYLVGEVWWESWPDVLMNPVPYTRGDVFDAVMFYQAYRPAKYFFSASDFDLDARGLADSLQFQWNRLQPANRYAMMNVSSTHDAPRLLTCFNNPGKYKFRSSASDNPAYKTGKPDSDTYRRVRLYLIHLFTSVGAPHIWNGEELGMWGGDDPEPRKPLWWPEFSFQPESRFNFQPLPKAYDSVGFNREHFEWYKKLISLRHQEPLFRNGEVEFTHTSGKMLQYRRFSRKEEIRVLLNAGMESGQQPIPPGRYINLLDGGEVSGGVVSLKPLSGMVLKRK